MPKPVENTFAALLTSFGDFLVVAIHTILYERHIYPLDTFITAKKYNYPIRQSRHPNVCKWITDAVSAVQEELLKGTIERVAVVIYSEYQVPLERFIFDLSKFPAVPREELFTPIVRADAATPTPAPALAPAAAPKPTTSRPGPKHVVNMVDLEEQFRAVFTRLTLCSTFLKPIPPSCGSCTFTLAIELKDATDPPIGHPQPWIPTQPELQRDVDRDGFPLDGSEESGLRSALGGVHSVPVRSVRSGEMVFEMWVEEGTGKEEEIAGSGNQESISSFED